MSKPCDPADDVQAGPTLAVAITAVVTLQLLLGLFIGCTGTDAGFAWTVYSCVLLGYWGVVALLSVIGLGNSRALGRVIVATAWLPPVWCVVWLRWFW